MTTRKNYLYLMLGLFLLTGCHAKNNSDVNFAKSANSSEIAYQSIGNSDVALIFIHCWTCNHTFWDRQTLYFSKRYQTVWLDLAGHGISKSARQDYTMQAFGDDIVAVVDSLRLKRVILIGHSMGGPVAIEAAKKLNDKVIGIIGVDTFYTDFEFPTDNITIEKTTEPFKKNFQVASEELIRSMFPPEADKDVIETIVNKTIIADPEMAISAFENIFQWHKESSKALQQFQSKLYNINTRENQKYHQKNIVIIPGSGHFIPQIKPDAFNQALEKIIRNIISHQ